MELLKIEDRAFGVMKEYIKVCEDSFSNVEGEEEGIPERILFLLKPILIREQKRLVRKKLTPADATITILNKSLDIIQGLLEEDDPLRTPVMEVKEVVGKVWGNIRNRVKKDAMYVYSDTIKTIIREGLIGKYPLTSISFRESHPKEPLKNPGVRFKEESPNKVIEINLM